MHTQRQSNRAFGLTFATVFLLVFAIGWAVFEARLLWAPIVSALFLGFALLAPGILLPLNRLWGVFAARLGVVNNYLILGLFFYAVVTPFGLIMRAFGWDPLGRTAGLGTTSYWSAVKRGTDRDTLKDMF